MNQIFSLQAINEIAQHVLSYKNEARYFFFKGDMGCGKTTLIKAICTTLGISEMVNSPTYTIMNEYKLGHDMIFHLDLYRIQSSKEIISLGIHDIITHAHMCFVEWGDYLKPLLVEPYIEIELEYVSENSRRCQLKKIREPIF